MEKEIQQRSKIRSIMTEYTVCNGKMEKLNTCRIFKEKSFATKPLQRTRKTREVILLIKWISKKYCRRIEIVSKRIQEHV